MDTAATVTNTGTKPKRGKNDAEKPKPVLCAKRTKANEQPMYISDTENVLALEEDLCNKSEFIEHDISSSSDELMDENETEGTFA